MQWILHDITEYKNRKEHDSIRTGNENAVDGK